ARGAVFSGALLAEHHFSTTPPGDERAHRLLRRPVGLRDRGQVRLRLDAQVERAKARERDRVGGVGELVRETKVGVHRRPATDRCGSRSYLTIANWSPVILIRTIGDHVIARAPTGSASLNPRTR